MSAERKQMINSGISFIWWNVGRLWILSYQNLLLWKKYSHANHAFQASIVTYFNLFNVLLSSSKMLVFIWKMKKKIKMMKNDFHIMLETFFVLEIFPFLSWCFGYVEKQLYKKACDFMTSQPGQKNNHNTHIAQYLKKVKETRQWNLVS